MWPLLLNAALIGAYIQQAGAAFRQRDVRFLMELFWNWQSSPLTRPRLERIHNNQIKRALSDLVSSGFASQRDTTYKLTRAGILHALNQIRQAGLEGRFEEFLFCRFFLKSYHERIFRLIEQDTPMPLAFRSEVRELFDTAKLERAKREALKRERQYFEDRISETENAVRFVESGLKSKTPLPEIVQEIERRFPYELNFQRPLSQLMNVTESSLLVSELTEGNRLRMKELWRHYCNQIDAQLSFLGK